MDNWNIQQVMANLPHRYPFLLIDRVLSCDPEGKLTAIKNVSAGEPWTVGHFPGKPVMPGVLMIEAIAQAGCILAYQMTDAEPDGKSFFYFAGVENAKFKKMVEPGDQLVIEVEFLKRKRDIWKLRGEVKVDGQLACYAEITSAYKA